MKKKQINSKPEKKSGFLKRGSLLILIFLISSGSSFVFAIPVYDALNHAAQFQVAATHESAANARFGIQEKSRHFEWFETMNRWATQFRNYREQFDHTVKVWDDVKQMRGNWKGTLQRLSDQQFVSAVIGDKGRDLVKLGWEIGNKNHSDIETLPDEALGALDRFEKIMTKENGNAFSATDPTLREDLQEIYGPVPGTRADIENAHRTIARAMATIGEINQAIKERQSNIEKWKGTIARGGLVPGDLERLEIMIKAEEQDIGLLNSRISAISVEVQMANTGLIARDASERETARAQAQSVANSFIEGAGLLNPGKQGNNQQTGSRNNFQVK